MPNNSELMNESETPATKEDWLKLVRDRRLNLNSAKGSFLYAMEMALNSGASYQEIADAAGYVSKSWIHKQINRIS